MGYQAFLRLRKIILNFSYPDVKILIDLHDFFPSTAALPSHRSLIHQFLCVVLMLTEKKDGGRRAKDREERDRGKHRHEMEMRKAHAPTQVGREASRKGLR